MFIIDAHEDLAFNVLADGRNYLESAYATRAREADNVHANANGVCMLGLPEWLQGGVAVIFATLTVIPRLEAKAGEPSYVFPEAAFQQAIAQLNIYRNWEADHRQITLITHQEQLDGVLMHWDKPAHSTPDQRQVGLVLLIENADLIRTIDEVDFWYEQGVRLIGPAWHSNRFTASSMDSGPLTELGRQLLAKMQSHNIILDLSHMADEACLEAIERYPGPIVATHANPRRMVAMQRLLSDQVISGLIGRDGVIGIMPVNWALDPAWRQKSKADIHVNLVIEAIDIVCQMAGNARHIGIGTDFDGGQGAEAAPAEIDTIADLTVIADGLRERGYPEGAISEIMHGNWERVLRSSLPKGP